MVVGCGRAVVVVGCGRAVVGGGGVVLGCGALDGGAVVDSRAIDVDVEATPAPASSEQADAATIANTPNPPRAR